MATVTLPPKCHGKLHSITRARQTIAVCLALDFYEALSFRTRSIFTLFLGGCVELAHQIVHVYAVDHAGLLHRLPAGGGAAEAVHSDGHENRCSLGGDIQNITNDCVFCNLSHKKQTSKYLG